MNFKERRRLTKEILKDCPYEVQKREIQKLFKKTRDDILEDILLRLIVIDSCYSTNLNRRLFGFENLAKFLLEKKYQKENLLGVKGFITDNLKKIVDYKVGIHKRGNLAGHALSLITKYFYYQTEGEFPIYDSIVFIELKKEGLVGESDRYKKIYFDQLIKITEKYKISFDELDIYFWVCGKIRKGSLSLLLPDKELYINDFLYRLFSVEELKEFKNSKLTSVQFDAEIRKKLNSGEDLFNNLKLKKIQRIARAMHKGERVFGDLIIEGNKE